MRISDWSSDVCSANEIAGMKIAIPVDRLHRFLPIGVPKEHRRPPREDFSLFARCDIAAVCIDDAHVVIVDPAVGFGGQICMFGPQVSLCRSEEHTSELQSLMRISYAVFC